MEGVDQVVIADADLWNSGPPEQRNYQRLPQEGPERKEAFSLEAAGRDEKV